MERARLEAETGKRMPFFGNEADFVKDEETKNDVDY